VHVLDQGLRLLHPFVPYVTEAIWQHLPRGGGEALIVAAWPEAGPVDAEALVRFGHLRDLIRAIRNARSEKKVEQARRITATVAAGGQAEWLGAQRPLLAALARLDEGQTQILEQAPATTRDAIALVVGPTEVYLSLEGLVDLGAERERLAKELADLDRQITKSAGLLASDFASKAPAAVVERERAKREELVLSRQKVAERLEAIKA
jgi:valyl-tRNA synthetase